MQSHSDLLKVKTSTYDFVENVIKPKTVTVYVFALNSYYETLRMTLKWNFNEN
jgi:hypothetical protein